LYVNGEQVTSFQYSTDPASSATTQVNSTAAHQLGQFLSAGSYYDGEMAEINFVDGRAVPIAELGAYSTYNQWLPIKYAGTYGTNGFYLPFTNTTSTSTLVADSSGNGNNWTPNNISLTAGSTYDSLTDVPTLTSTTVANYAVLNPLANPYAVTMGNVNLTTSYYPTSAAAGPTSTIGVSSGKWYFEFSTVNNIGISADLEVGIIINAYVSSTYYTVGAQAFTYGFNASSYYTRANGTYSGNLGAAGLLTTTDIGSIAYDLDNRVMYLYKNNTLLTSLSLPAGYTWYVFSGSSSSAAQSIGANYNFGQRPFVYTAPTGFLPLNTFNIPAGTVTTSGTFTGNLSTDGPMVYLNGTPTAMTINGNAVTFGTHADKLANGFKVRSSSASYNASGSNTYVATTVGAVFKYEDAQGNP
jgi:hypothetical protein